MTRSEISIVGRLIETKERLSKSIADGSATERDVIEALEMIELAIAQILELAEFLDRLL